MKYRKRPVIIESVQLKSNNETDDANLNEIVAWVNSHAKGGMSLARHDGTQIHIATLEGTMTAQVGDYIIRGVKNEFYPCKPDIFEATYDAVNESDEHLLSKPVLRHKDGSASYLTQAGLDMIRSLRKEDE